MQHYHSNFIDIHNEDILPRCLNILESHNKALSTWASTQYLGTYALQGNLGDQGCLSIWSQTLLSISAPKHCVDGDSEHN